MAARTIDTTARPSRRGQWLRMAVSGAPSAGKTYSALLWAEVLGGRTLFIDTELAGPETGSSELFADRFPNFVPFLWRAPYSPVELAETIERYAGDFDTILVDSASHFWQDAGGTQDIVDKAAARMGGNSFAGWAEGTPAQNRMVQALLSARCHVIFCMRSKVEWELQRIEGKLQPVAVGTSAIQRPGLEYEFALALHLDQAHRVTVTKSRIESGGFRLSVGDEFAPVVDAGGSPRLPARLVEEVTGWLGSAGSLVDAAPAELVAAVRTGFDLIPAGPARADTKAEFMGLFGRPENLTADNVGDAMAWVRAKVAELTGGEVPPAPPAPPAPVDPGPAAPDPASAAARAPAGPRAPGPPRARQSPANKAKGKPPAKVAASRKSPAAPAAPVSAPAEDPAPQAPPTPEEAPEAQRGDGSKLKATRAAMTDWLLKLPAAHAGIVTSELKAHGLWPIDELSLEQLDEAADVNDAAMDAIYAAAEDEVPA